ncbi:FitA-like ribbon-helix-helix domain-containing protein [Acidocella facilis]|uniref:FitA-like ribbon-helix-helix domain-containing protein n=1 Tax=Acidocella facilis TaxID=525 RepID=UPI001F3C1E3B|nr:plasmid stabilization protein [Acidocella facilis]
MATLTVRNLDETIVRRLRVRAAEHGRSAEAEHREILRLSLLESDGNETERQQAAARLAEFRRRTAGRGSRSSAELLQESRTNRIETLAGRRDGA